MGITIMDKQQFYLKESAEEINRQENQYDKLPVPERKFRLSASFFLNKIRDIAFCRKKGLPTKQKEKALREYRDYDVTTGEKSS